MGANMQFLFTSLIILLSNKSLAAFWITPKYSDKISNESPNDRISVKHGVALEDELEFYKLANKIKPETLKILMPNLTEEPYVRTRPSSHCCFNGGTCYVPTNDRADRFCACPSNFKGRHCSKDVDECESLDACSEHELCRNSYGSYDCLCEHGYVREGLRCTRKTDCYEDPCMNFSDCVDLDEGRIICICRPGFKGTRCEIRVRECEDSTCTEEETCVATPDGFRCFEM